jgi:hypothetical protein
LRTELLGGAVDEEYVFEKTNKKKKNFLIWEKQI